MKIIRWPRVIAALIFIVVVWLVAFLLSDPIAKWALVKGGESLFGAKVEVQSVHISFRKTSMTIARLAVANKNAPMKNLFELEEATFDAMALPLLEKRVVIQAAAIRGIRLGTPRKTSGALLWPPQKPGVVTKAVDRLWSQIETISLDKWGDIKKFSDPKTLINPDALKVTAVAKQAQEEILKTPDRLKSKVSTLNVEARSHALKERITALGNGGSDPQAILNKIQEAKTIQTDLSTLKTDIASAQQNVTQEIQASRQWIESVKQAKEEDLKNLRHTFSVPALDSSTLARALLGPSVARYLEQGLEFYHKAKNYMPAKAQQPPPPPRGQGRTIEFPRLHEWPHFLLIKSELSGEIGETTPLQFKGELNGVTSNPALYGKPMMLILNGAQGARLINFRGILDFTQEITRTQVKATYNGFALSAYNLGQPGSFSLTTQGGTGSAAGSFQIEGDRLTGDVSGSGNNLTLTPAMGKTGDSDIAKRLASTLTSAFTSVHTLTAHVHLGGTLESPDLTVDSNIGQVVSNAFKGVVGAEVAKQEAALKAELDRLTNAKIQELSQQVDVYQKQFLGPLISQNKLVEDLLAQAKNKATAGSGVSGVRSKAQDALKGLFGH